MKVISKIENFIHIFSKAKKIKMLRLFSNRY